MTPQRKKLDIAVDELKALKQNLQASSQQKNTLTSTPYFATYNGYTSGITRSSQETNSTAFGLPEVLKQITAIIEKVEKQDTPTEPAKKNYTIQNVS